MRIAFITLSADGERLIARLTQELTGSDIYVHDKAPPYVGAKRFTSIRALTAEQFPRYGGLIYIAPCGVVVRAIAPHLGNKHKDPAVVVVDAGGRYAVSLLSGHEGGANDLAVRTANIIGAEPVITTTTEASKTLIVGVGCRRGATALRIMAAVRQALAEAEVHLDQVRLLASADLKADETGLLTAARELGLPLRFISADEIRSTSRAFTPSQLAREKINLPAVAEPAALLAGRRTQLLLPRRTYNGITIAIAREGSWWSASDPAAP